MIEGFVSKQAVVDMLLDLRNTPIDDEHDAYAVHNNLTIAIDLKLKELM